MCVFHFALTAIIYSRLKLKGFNCAIICLLH